MKLYKSGEELQHEIAASVIPADGIGMWNLGQAGYFFKTGETSFVIDPYLSDWVYELVGEPWVRKFAPPILPDQLGEIDFVLCTHHHEDHMDKLSLLGIYNTTRNTKFIVPKAHVGKLLEWGIGEERVIGISHQQSLQQGVVRIDAFKAMHDVFEQDEQGEHKFMGYVLNVGEFVIYHAGDTLVFAELVEWLKGKQVDIAMVPINGRDFQRTEMGIVGNCNYRDAADLGVSIQADLLMPIHFGLFPHNDENPAYFVDYLYQRYPSQKFHMMTAGERFIYFK